MNNQSPTSTRHFLREICATLLLTGILLTPVIISTTSRVSDSNQTSLDSKLALKQRLEEKIILLQANPDFTNKNSAVYQEYRQVMQSYGNLGDSIYFATTNEGNH